MMDAEVELARRIREAVRDGVVRYPYPLGTGDLRVDVAGLAFGAVRVLGPANERDGFIDCVAIGWSPAP